MLLDHLMIISRLVIKTVIKRTDLPSLFIGITQSFFTVSRSLISNFGYLPVLGIVRFIHFHIIKGTKFDKLPTSHLPSFIVTPLLAIIEPHWKDCLVYADRMSKYFFFFFYFQIRFILIYFSQSNIHYY